MAFNAVNGDVEIADCLAACTFSPAPGLRTFAIWTNATSLFVRDCSFARFGYITNPGPVFIDHALKDCLNFYWE